MISLESMIQKYVFLGDSTPKLDKKIEIPVFHCHGEADDIIPFAVGQKSSNTLTDLIERYEFHSFPQMKHEANSTTMRLLKTFLKNNLPPI